MTRSDNPLWDLICQTVKDALISTKVGATAGGVTIATGIGTIFEWLPANVGLIASLAGLSLTIVLTWSAFRRERRESAEAKRDAARFEVDMKLARKELEAKNNG